MPESVNDINHLFNVQGMVAVVTGGGSGLGAYAARALDANGAKAVYIVGRRMESLQDTVKSGKNGSIIPITGDVTSRESLVKIAQQVREEQGFVNLVFANAGILGPMNKDVLPPKAPHSIADIQKSVFEGISMEDFTQTYHVNCTAMFYTAMAFLDLLDAGNKKKNLPQTSQVLVTTSIAGFNRSILSGFSYNASKAAANHLIKILATYFAQNQLRIRVNAVAPGLFPSEMTDQLFLNGPKTEEGRDDLAVYQGAAALPVTRIPVERTGSELEFAGTVLYMVGRAGAYLNGQITVPDGGSMALQPSAY